MVLLALSLPCPAGAQEPPPLPLPARPVSTSVDRVVDKLEKERADPCRSAIEQGRPCFPSSTERRKPDASVRESLLVPLPDGPSPGRPPTVAEMGPHRPGPQSTLIALGGFDPGCAIKAVRKILQGRSDVFYIYLVRDKQGERAAMYSERQDPATFQGEIELVGRFRGECEALQAFRRAERKVRDAKEPELSLPHAQP